MTRKINNKNLNIENKENILSLRPKIFILKIDPKKTKDFFVFHKKPIIIVLVIVISLTLSILGSKTTASVNKFYSTNCLGGWENPSNAQGAPDVEDPKDISLFNRNNSAIVQNSNSVIFCGNFYGEVPNQSQAKKFTLKFSLALKDELQNEEMVTQVIEESSVSKIPSVEENDNTSEVINNNEKSSGNHQELEEKHLQKEKNFLNEEESKQESTVNNEENKTKETSSVGAWLLDNFRSKKVLAQDAENDNKDVLIEAIGGKIDSEISISEKENPNVLDENYKKEEIILNTDLIEENQNLESGQEKIDMSFHDGDEFLAVNYTLDGERWRTLGYISSNNWQGISFEIVDDRLADWQDLLNLQVSLQVLPSLDILPVVFLDSVYLEVEYQEEKSFEIEDNLPQIVLSEDFIATAKEEYSLFEDPTFIFEKIEFTKSELEEMVDSGEAKIKKQDDDFDLEDIKDIFKEDNSIKFFGKDSLFVNLVDLFSKNKIKENPENLEKERVEDIKNKKIEKEPESIIVEESKEGEISENIEVIEVISEEQEEVVDTQKNPNPSEEKQSQELPENAINLNFLKENKFSWKTKKVQAQSSNVDPVSFKNKIRVEIVSDRGETLVPKYQIKFADLEEGEKSFQINLLKNQGGITPGRYIFRVYSKEDNYYLLYEKTFNWGVLAVNTDRSVAIPGVPVFIQMATLDNYGHTICGANLKLTITSPSGPQTVFETSNDSSLDGENNIARSSTCGRNNYTEDPDYFLYYTPDTIGKFDLKLENLDRAETIYSSFESRINSDFDVVRQSATRTNPFLNQNYFMSFTIKAQNNFSGKIIETVPEGFVIVPSSEYTTRLNSKGEVQIVWQKNINAGETINLSYEYDPPDVSPFLFSHGPLEFFTLSTNNLNKITPISVWREARQWQVASDAACSSAGSGNWTAITWTGCVSGPQPGDTVTISSGHTVTLNTDASINSITITGTLNNDSNARILTLTGTSGTLFTRTGTFTPGTFIEIKVTSASGTPTFLSGATTFYKLTIDSAATVINMGAAITISNSSGSKLYVKNGVFNASGASITGPGTGNGTFQIDASASFCLGGTTASTNATCDSGATETTVRLMPVFQTYTFDPNSNVYFLNDAALTSGNVISISPAYGNLIFRPLITAARSYTFATGNITINGNFLVYPNKTSTAAALTVTLAGNLNMQSSSTIDLTRSGVATITFTTSASNYSVNTGYIINAASSTINANGSVITLNGTSGTLLTRGGTFTRGTSEVVASPDSGNVTLMSAATTFNKLTIDANSSSQVISTSSVITISNTNASNRLYIKNGVLDVQVSTANAIVGTTNGTMVMDSGAILKLGASGTANNFPTNFTNGIITLNTGSTVVYQAGVNQTVSGVPTYSNLRITPLSGTPHYALGAATTVNGNLTIDGGTLVTVANTLTGPGSGSGTFTIASGATFCLSNGAATSCTTSSTTAVSMPVFQNYDFDTNSTVKYMGNVNMTVASIPTYGILHFAPVMSTTPIVYTASGDITVLSDLRMYATGSSSRVNRFDLAGTLDVGGVIDLRPGANSTTVQLDTTSGGNYTVKAESIILGQNNTGRIGALIANASIIELYGTSGTLITRQSVTGSFAQGTSEVKVMSPSGAPTFLSTTVTFHKLTIDSGATIKAGAVIAFSNADASNKFYIKSGILEDDGSQVTGTANGTMQMDSGSTFKIGSGSASGFPTNYINGNITLNSGSLVIYNATVAQTISGTPTYANLQLSTVSGSPTKTLGAATTINGNLTIDSNNTFDVSGSNYQLTLKGNYTNNGTFNSRNGTVLLNGTSTQTLSGTMTSGSAFYGFTVENISGSVSGCSTSFTSGVSFSSSASFNTFTILTTSLSSGVYVQFNSGSTYSVSNINWVGTNTKKIYFRNSNLSSGAWALNYTPGTLSVSYVDVSRSDASGGTQINPSNTTNTDCNNNTNWDFGFFSISGTVYKSDESTLATTGNGGSCDGSTANLSLRVNGGTATTTTCSNSDATFSFSGIVANSGDTITIYSTGSNKANTVYLSDGGVDSGIVLYYDALVVGQTNSNSTTLTISHLNDYDNDQNGTDMLYTANGTPTLTIDDGIEIHIQTGKTFAPGGIITTSPSSSSSSKDGDVHIVGTLSMGTNSISVGGDFNNVGTFSKSTGQMTTFTATATGHIITDGGSNFDSITFNGSGGGWSFADSTILDENLTISNGLLDPTGVTIDGSGVSNVLTVDSTQTLLVEGENFTDNYSDFETINLDIGSTVNYFKNGGSQNIDPNLNYYNLEVSIDGNKYITNDTTILGILKVLDSTILDTDNFDLTAQTIFIDSGAEIQANGSLITVLSDWNNIGNFVAETSEVFFTGNFDSFISGNTIFYNLRIGEGVAKNVYFSTDISHKIEILGLFTVSGASSNYIKLWSHINGVPNPGVKWYIDHQGTEIVEYADIKDGGCETGSTQITTVNSINSLNNDTCWVFGTSEISFSLDSNSINLGSINTSSASFGSNTFSAFTNALGGFSVYVIGNNLSTDFGSTISSIGVMPSTSLPGIEQFGINLRANSSPSVGADVVANSGTCGYGSGFGTVDEFKFEDNTENVLTNVTGPADCEYTVSYIGNISPITESGNYSTVLTYVIIGTF